MRLRELNGYLCRDTIRTVLNLPPSTIMEYKSNNGEGAEEPEVHC